MEKCQCYIHSLKQGENHVLGEQMLNGFGTCLPKMLFIWQSITA